MINKLARFSKSYTRWLHGDLKPIEIKKFGLFALIFFFTIGGYWFLAPLKDCLFLDTVCTKNDALGSQIALGKMISTLCIFGLLPIYFYLIDKLPGHKVFYGIFSFYIPGIIFFSIFFNSDFIYIVEYKRIMAWAWYVFVETFGAFLPALFWSFVSDHTMPDQARKGYSMIALGGVLGGIVGSYIVKKLVVKVGTPYMMLFASLWLLFIPLLISYSMSHLSKYSLRGYHSKEVKPRPGFTEGIKLLLQNKYLLAIFAAIAFNEITQVLIDVHFKTYAQNMFPLRDDLGQFFSFYAQSINTLALICLLLRIDLLGKKMGVKKSLVLLPIFVGLGIGAIMLMPNLYTAFGAIVITKALNFAFNQPSKEQLYIPTTPTSKYKAKGWIDIFGYQLSRSLGWGAAGYQALVSPTIFLYLSSGIGFMLVIIWIFTALFAGNKYQRAVRDNEVIC